MSRGRHIATKTRTGRSRWGILALALGLFLALATPAGAGVERYQFKTTSYTVTYTIGGNNFPQTFTVTANPCDGTFSGAGNQPFWGATWTYGTIDGTTINYTTEYLDDPWPGGGSSYALTANATNFDPVTGNFSGTWTDTLGNTTGTMVGVAGAVTSSNYNHGEYVAETMDEFGPDAHSCIGMPLVSGRR